MLCAFAFNISGIFNFVEEAHRNYGSVIVSVAKFFGISTSGFSSTKVIFGGYAIFLSCPFLGLLSNPIPDFSRTKLKEMGITSSDSDDGRDSISNMSVSTTDVSEKKQSDAELSNSTMFIPSICSVLADYKPNPFRFSGSSSVRLSMKTLMLLSLFVNVANGCGDHAYRCVSDLESISQDWAATENCMQKVGFSLECECWHRFETYAHPFGDDIQSFIDCCESYGNQYVAREC